jgi:hypothetical protein
MKKDDFNGVSEIKPLLPSKLDPFKPTIDQW